MAENNDTDNMTMQTSENEAVKASQSLDASRPKLKKIKRPKIRPISDAPVAPQKVSESDVNDTSVADMTQTTAQDSAQTSGGTDLITSVEAQNLTTQNAYNDSYVLEALPPELDYMTDDDGNIEFLPQEQPFKKIIAASILCFVAGLFFGSLLFSSRTEEKHGLEGVVLNPDVPSGRPRCGLTDKSQACIFYIMNCYKQELTGRDFYKLAAQLTSREEYMIETENLRYSNVKIKPGHFAQINIPALK